jgi:recombination protein RecT
MSEAKKVATLPAPALPRENFKPIKQCENLDQLFQSAEFRERITASVPRYMTNERMLSVVLRAHVTNPLLLQATPQSFAGACLTATNTGLEPNSALAEAHLIPFRTTLKRRGQPDRQVIQIQVIFGYQGLLKLVDNTGRVLSRSANVVYPDADVFDWMEGSDTFLKYKRGGRRDRGPNDKPGYAFFHARLQGGGETMEVWPYGDVLRIRNLSQAYRRALNAYQEAQAKSQRPPFTWTEAPWVKHEEPMARKTMIRAGVKYLPKSVELASAVRIDELHDRRDLDYSRVIDLAGNAEEPDYAGAAVQLGEQAEREEEPQGETQGTEGGTQGGDGPPDDGDPGWSPDAGAAFGMRTPDSGQQSSPNPDPASTEPKRAGGGPQENGYRPLKGDQGGESVAQGASQQNPSFEAYLIDEAGEFDGPYVDPVAWAKAFIALFDKTSDKPTYLENNEDALAEARRFPVADQLLDVTHAPRDLPPPTTLHVSVGRGGKPDWADYVNGFRHILFGWRGDLALWFEAQRKAMGDAPLATRLLLIKAARERAEQVQTPLPEWVGALAGPAQKAARPTERKTAPDTVPDTASDIPPPDANTRFAEGVEAHLKTLKIADDVRAYGRSDAVQTVMKRLRGIEPPALFNRVEAAFAKRLTALGAGPPASAK